MRHVFHSLFFSLVLLITPVLGEMNALVILEAKDSSGSGFLVEQDGKTYVFTNLHVLMGGKPTLKLLDGTKLRAGKLSMARDRDLARIEVEGRGLKTIPIRTELPAVSDPVQVLGNSDGAGVATVLRGKVLGVGPELVEIDAPFVQGNSGSPILDARGRLLGVASFATLNVEPENWLKSDTRFRGIRRFGYRVNGVDWQEISWQGLGKRVRMLEDLERLCFDLFLMKYTTTYRGENGFLAFKAAKGRTEYREYKVFATWMESLSKGLNRASEDYLSKALEEDPNLRAMQNTRMLRRGSGLGVSQGERAAWQREKERYDRWRSTQRVQALNYFLLNDPGFFQDLPEMQRLGRNVRSRLIHDHWGSEFLEDQAKDIYETFLIISNGEILDKLPQR